MDRETALTWLREHPAAVHGDPSELVQRFEAEVRRHAEEDAWLAAKAHVEGRMHEWEKRWGSHSSEAYAARQICPELAEELKRLEPHFEVGDAPHLVGAERLAALEPEARWVVQQWVRDVANEVEHRIWQEVVHYTEERGRGLVREGRVSQRTGFSETLAYSQQAARVARILVDEFEARAHPHA